MNLWIDTEFNEYKGELISMALVDEVGLYWYEVLHCDFPGPWVAQHVMPVLNQAPVALKEMQRTLQMFLTGYDSINIIADWPEDIAFFLRTLITGPGQRIDILPLFTMEVRRDLESTSQMSVVPHNALEDARALRLSHLKIGLERTAVAWEWRWRDGDHVWHPCGKKAYEDFSKGHAHEIQVRELFV